MWSISTIFNSGQLSMAYLTVWHITITMLLRTIGGLDGPKVGQPGEPSLRSLINSMGGQSNWNTRLTECLSPTGSSIYTILRWHGHGRMRSVHVWAINYSIHMDWHSMGQQHWVLVPTPIPRNPLEWPVDRVQWEKEDI